MRKKINMRCAIKVSLFLTLFLYDHCIAVSRINNFNGTSSLMALWSREENVFSDGGYENRLRCKSVGMGLEMFCLRNCQEHDECPNPYKCFKGYFQFCYRSCVVDGDCESHMTCYEAQENNVCFYKECFDDDDCKNSICVYHQDYDKKCCLRKCDCGKNGNCRFEEGQKICLCKPGFAEKDGICTETCKDGNDCRNDLVCADHGGHKFCSCKPGLIGDKCETVFDCTPQGKYKDCTRSGGKCSYNGSKAICECSGNQNFNDRNLVCEACDCGSNGDCSFVNGQKKCNCKQGFTDKNGTCTDCICRGGTCVKENGKEVCKCPPGYGNFTKSFCKACDCGPNTSCIWKSTFGGDKVCLCKPGYSTKKGKCTECNCGPESSCEWISEGWLKPEKKVCHCKSGYREDNGKCVDEETSSPGGTMEPSLTPTSLLSTVQDIATSTRKSTTESFILSTSISSTVSDSDCHCGSFSYSCSYDPGNNKICSCFPSYSQLGGSCAECNCGPYGLCKYENGKKKCNCKPFATEMNGNCVDKQDFKTFLLSLLDKFL